MSTTNFLKWIKKKYFYYFWCSIHALMLVKVCVMYPLRISHYLWWLNVLDLGFSGIYCCREILTFDIEEIARYTLSSLMDIHQTRIRIRSLAVLTRCRISLQKVGLYPPLKKQSKRIDKYFDDFTFCEREKRRTNFHSLTILWQENFNSKTSLNVYSIFVKSYI